MTATPEHAPPASLAEIRARLDEIAPVPRMGTPDRARALAKTIAVAALRRNRRHLTPFWFSDDDAGRRLEQESVSVLCYEFAALHLLMASIGGRGVPVNGLAAEITGAWDDGGGVGECLWDHATALGIDPAEVDRLEDAWQALPGSRPGTDTTPVTRGELAAAALAADRARETIAMLGEDLIRQRKRAERAEAALRGAQPDATGATEPAEGDALPWYALGLEGADPETEIADLRSRIHHAGAALAGENEGVRLWMLDCGNLVDKHRKRAERAEAEVGSIRDLAESWTEDDGHGTPTLEMAIEAECGRQVLAILEGEATGSVA